MTGADLAVFGRTMVYPRAGKMVHRARLCTHQAGLHRFSEAARLAMPGPDAAATVGSPDAFRLLDALTLGRWPSLPELRQARSGCLACFANWGIAPGWDHVNACVLPGLPGRAQMNGCSEMTWPERIEWDLQYVASQGLWLDLNVLVRTVQAILIGDGLAGHSRNDSIAPI